MNTSLNYFSIIFSERRGSEWLSWSTSTKIYRCVCMHVCVCVFVFVCVFVSKTHNLKLNNNNFRDLVIWNWVISLKCCFLLQSISMTSSNSTYATTVTVFAIAFPNVSYTRKVPSFEKIKCPSARSRRMVEMGGAIKSGKLGSFALRSFVINWQTNRADLPKNRGHYVSDRLECLDYTILRAFTQINYRSAFCETETIQQQNKNTHFVMSKYEKNFLFHLRKWRDLHPIGLTMQHLWRDILKKVWA